MAEREKQKPSGDEERMPTDEEMRGWQVDVPHEGPLPESGELEGEEAEALRTRVEEMREEETSEVQPAMSEDELRTAGVGIDLPTESASSDPKDVAYSDGTTLLDRLRQNHKRETGGSRGGASGA